MKMPCTWVFAAVLFFVVNHAVALPAQSSGRCEGPVELQGAISTRPTSAAYNALGAYFARRNEIPCAIAAFEKALKLNPKSWETHYNLGLALRSTGELKRAGSELQDAVAENPGEIKARIA